MKVWLGFHGLEGIGSQRMAVIMGDFEWHRLEAILIWLFAAALCAAVLFFYIRRNRRRERQNLFVKREAVELKIDRPPAQHPQIDENACIGCGSCVSACPEGGVLGLVSGRATILNGLRCVGHGKCAEACPVDAVKIGLGDLSKREDIPRCDTNFETNIPGIYIAGELGGLALIKNAVKQGSELVRTIAETIKPAGDSDVVDVLIVGAGPAGLSSALAAKEAGFSFQVVEQEAAGGTILQYPRRKMMLTQPVEIPLYGWLKKPQYVKEELLEIWNDIIESQALPISTGEVLGDIHHNGSYFEVITSKHIRKAHRVILALGRRGTPRKLGAPGEDKAKVMYKLLDAASYQNEHVLVVGGGDSAVEAAIALAKQPQNKTTLSYRKHKFFRIKKKNLELLEETTKQGLLEVIYQSDVTEIEDHQVHLKTAEGPLVIPNDFVFIFAGGIPPFGLLKKVGVAFGSGGETQTQNPEKTPAREASAWGG